MLFNVVVITVPNSPYINEKETLISSLQKQNNQEHRCWNQRLFRLRIYQGFLNCIPVSNDYGEM